MKKLITLSFVLLLVLSMSAFATDTRVMTLGNTNNVLLDEANIWMYPSRINDYPNLAIAEFGTPTSFSEFGVHFKLNRDHPWILAGYFDNLPTSYPNDLFGNNLLPARFNDSLMDNHRINLFYGSAMGQVNLGLRLSALQSSHTADKPNDQNKQAFAYYTLNGGLTSNNGAWDLAGKIGIGTWTDEDAAGNPFSKKDGFYDLSVIGRYFYQVNPNYTLIPHAGIYYSKRGLKDYYDGTNVASDTIINAVENKATTVELGCGTNYTPATNVLAVVDLGMMYDKHSNKDTQPGPVTTETTDTQVWLPYFKIGLDADIFRWLDVRMGATSVWNRESSGQTSVKDKYNYVENATYLGFGFHWGRFHVDSYTDPNLFLRGFNFISGETTNMNFQLSAVYEMM